MVFVGRDITDIVQSDTQEITLLGPLQNTFRKWTLKHGGEKRENVEMHVSTHLYVYVLQ
ncbi:hypothetical protein KSZ_63640 [Dictyobacter formicarum]|uniref:Uncharacterized protein n=1 Tax=Dictyobacter formicarum TaxID=2778368 RepID=A0ABQ3VRZ3_9CHLR|nr:hypothetical protein KSZ_63640 [Dictyobacter formicarum]